MIFPNDSPGGAASAQPPALARGRSYDPDWTELVQGLQQMTLRCDERGHCDHASPEWARFTGRPVQHLLGEGWLSVLHPDDGRPLRPGGWQTLAPAPWSLEVRVRRHDGQWCWFRLQAAVLGDSQGDASWFVVAHDVERLWQATRARDAAQEQLQRYIDELPVGVVRCDLGLRILHINPAAERIFGWRSEDAQGRDVLGTLLSSSMADRLEEMRRALMLSPEPITRTQESLSRDGRTLTCEWSSTTEHDARGRICGFRSTVVDMTERMHEQQRQLRDAQRMAGLTRRLINAQEDERRSIALELHEDLGQQLAALRIGLATMVNGDAAHAVRSKLQDSLAIVDAALSQIRRRALALRPPMLDDIGLAATLEWYCAMQQDRSRVPVRVRCRGDLRGLDRTLVTAAYRIVQEAVANALSHGGPRNIDVDVDACEDALTVSVRDNGRGFDVHELEAHPLPMGLGLPAMRERAHLLGGALTVTAIRGAGVAIHARLPRSESGADRPSRP